MEQTLYHYKAFVTQVYDGDTVTVDIDLGLHTWMKGEKLRLYRINAPELRGEEKEAGKITHYFTNIGVAVIELSDELSVGDTIHLKGATSDFTQKVESMQIERQPVRKAGKGESVGLKVTDHAREGDKVYKVIE